MHSLKRTFRVKLLWWCRWRQSLFVCLRATLPVTLELSRQFITHYIIPNIKLLILLPTSLSDIQREVISVWWSLPLGLLSFRLLASTPSVNCFPSQLFFPSIEADFRRHCYMYMYVDLYFVLHVSKANKTLFSGHALHGQLAVLYVYLQRGSATENCCMMVMIGKTSLFSFKIEYFKNIYHFDHV